ncbi:MAG: hypothetical protein WC901_05715 [Candidatus Margulisiibacteriota bacterium]
MNNFPHLQFKDWPFQVVPDERFVEIWADRKEVLADIHNLLQGFSRRKQSTINLLWAWFGAGKSHTLRHMQYLCRTKYQTIIPIYTEFPKSVKSFFDVYRYFINGIGFELFKEVIAEVPVTLADFSDFPEIMTAVDLISTGDLQEKDIAWRWMRGDKIYTQTLRRYNLDTRIETCDDAVRAMALILRLLEKSGKYSRVLWMIDEFQRIGVEKNPIWEDVNTGLHSTFNACPNALSLFLSFSVHEKQDMIGLLSREIIDRIGISKIIRVPQMSRQDAFAFVADLMFAFRPDIYNLPATYFPFTEDAVRFILLLIEKNAELKPRSIMQYFNVVLERAEPAIALNQMSLITIDYVKQILQDYDLFLTFQGDKEKVPALV